VCELEILKLIPDFFADFFTELVPEVPDLVPIFGLQAEHCVPVALQYQR
jgi:hypothetical protein